PLIREVREHLLGLHHGGHGVSRAPTIARVDLVSPAPVEVLASRDPVDGPPHAVFRALKNLLGFPEPGVFRRLDDPDFHVAFVLDRIRGPASNEPRCQLVHHLEERNELVVLVPRREIALKNFEEMLADFRTLKCFDRSRSHWFIFPITRAALVVIAFSFSVSLTFLYGNIFSSQTSSFRSSCAVAW